MKAANPYYTPLLDARYFQIVALAGILVYSQCCLSFGPNWTAVALAILAALAVQWIASKMVGLAHFEYRSALISGLGLCNLLRSDSAWIYALAAGIAIAGKFVFRVRGKHVFNPTNLAIVLLLLADSAWTSAGQWGASAIFVFALVCGGGLVTLRAMRADLTLSFLLAFAAIAFGRSFYLGDPLAVPLHRLQNGSLLIFAFFMISDPRSTPDRRAARIFFAALVAFVAAWIEFGLYRNNGVFWALALCSPLSPLLDRLAPASRHEWDGESMGGHLRRVLRLPGGEEKSARDVLNPM
ncbi:MAG: RnfABCDGE type electron transport complex subunit D [Leptospirales bacterium]|nr:RnfABCDGE type electron transport complex subunit D [Leptospirales bacterium]